MKMVNGVLDSAIILPARIVEWFPEEQTATVQISVEKIHNNIDEYDTLTVRTELRDVPVHTAYGGGFAITFPIKKGDTCLMMFSQVGYDHWLFDDKDESGYLVGKPKPYMYRSFSEDDGFCMVGFNTLPRKITGVSNQHSVWRDKSLESSITIKDNGDITVLSGGTEIDLDKNGTITMNAPLVIVNADMQINGDVVHTGNNTQVGDAMQTGKRVLVGNDNITGNTKHTGIHEVSVPVPNPNVVADVTI